MFLLPLLPLLLLFPSASSFGTSPQKKCIIKICHNKDCCKKGGGDKLLSTFRDLVPFHNTQLDIQSTGCLSQCGKGPNICVVGKNGGDEKIYYNVKDALDASAVLDVATPEIEYPIELLVAASNIHQAEHTASPAKKEELMTVVITDLSKNSKNSYALFHALTIRADARLDTNNIDGAIDDARLAAEIFPTEGKVWRILASAEEQRGSFDSAIVALGELARADPSFATKARNEIERLSS
mmetsp:Transcript_22237/g.34910  ORF Transcript_22237/g.34910 Transcript_22237/m.34910 type:complete len:239 (-) Transcript_22237:1110-1826(-)